ncbi:class IV adenylate cyclase [Patescibacteria group bacterium]|nr:class IV adenylate cyclase [Patescibacteria group bacterium]
MKNVEIEVRSFITKEEYKRLLKKFNKKAKFVNSIKEETVYFSLNDKKDLRLRCNEKEAFLILKKGKIHDNIRQELKIRFAREDFAKLEELLKAIGFRARVKWFRKRRVYLWDKIKVFLDDTKSYGFIIELEKIGRAGEAKKIYKNLKNKLKSLGIKITPKKVFDEKFKYYKDNWEKILNYIK